MSTDFNENTFKELPEYTLHHNNPLKHAIIYDKYIGGRASFEYEFTFMDGGNVMVDSKDLGDIIAILNSWQFEDLISEINKFYALKKTYRELIPALVEVKEEIDYDDLESLTITARECERARCEARKMFGRMNQAYGCDKLDAACHVYASIVRIDGEALIDAYDNLGWL